MKTFALLIAAFVAACSSLPPVPPPDAPIQQCLVCRHRRDFSCLDVEKSTRTPQAVAGGRTYYFCGESCRCEFQRNAAKYVNQR